MAKDGTKRLTRERQPMITTAYKVTGMSCEHCVNAVSSELGSLGGVSAVTVDLVPDGVSLVTVISAAPLADDAVSAALDEAGDYRVTAG
ncbi:MAG TPA: heavy-metal-associated domain-containing protein [Trebonia sp.]